MGTAIGGVLDAGRPMIYEPSPLNLDGREELHVAVSPQQS